MVDSALEESFQNTQTRPWCGGAFGTPLGEAAGHQPDTDAFIASIGRIDAGIEHTVRVLHENHVETYESCQGGEGHAFPEPTVRFYGSDAEGFRALSVALTFGLPVKALRRFWSIQGGLPHGPQWEMTFAPPKASASHPPPAE